MATTTFSSWGRYWFGAVFGTRALAPWVPTFGHVIPELMKAGAVTRHDTLCDVGCGDGRVVIAAAQQTGCAAIGIETDAALVANAHKALAEAAAAEAAAAAGSSSSSGSVDSAVRPLSERVRIVQGDARKAIGDLAQATVVTMYLSESGNARMAPILVQALGHKPPGSVRICSYVFPVKGWRPHRTHWLAKTKQPIYVFELPPLLDDGKATATVAATTSTASTTA